MCKVPLRHSPTGIAVCRRHIASEYLRPLQGEVVSNRVRWPAIIGIVVGSLILLSVLFCLVQCLCCGVSCAKMLCCCCRGCGRGGSKRPQFKDDYRQMPPTPYQGYQPTPAPMYQGPHTATFDSSKKINDDSLPAMPSWDTARTHRVEDMSMAEQKHTEDLEMGHMGPQHTGYNSRSGYNQVPNGPVSPTSPIHSQQGYFNQPPDSYHSDLGAQRMGQTNSYNDFDRAPLSPAPTYHTNPTSGLAATDRFAPGANSPSPYQYQNQPTHSPLYAPSTNLSTRYEQTDYNSTHHHQSVSPPLMAGGRPPSFGHGAYDHAYDSGHISPQNQRPPSLLQIGRKAVPGSNREI